MAPSTEAAEQLAWLDFWRLRISAAPGAGRAAGDLPTPQPSLRRQVLSPDSPSWCSAQNACHGCRLRANRGAPSGATRRLRSGSVHFLIPVARALFTPPQGDKRGACDSVRTE